MRRPRAAQERAEGRPDSGLLGSATRAHRHCGSRGCMPPAVTALPICARLGLQPPHGAFWKPEPRSKEGGCSHPLLPTTGRRPGRRSGGPSLCLGCGGAGSGEGPSRPHRAGQQMTASPRAALQALGVTDHRLCHVCLGPTAAVSPPPPVSSEPRKVLEEASVSPAFLLPGLHVSRSLFLSETPSPDFLAGPAVKNLPPDPGTQVRPLVWEDPVSRDS